MSKILYVWDADAEQYEPVRALTGPKGEKGDTGATGAQGPKGETGATGATGATGPQGPQGAQGVQGPKGEDGTSYTVKGMFATLSALQEAHPTGNAGDAWFVGSSESSVIYQWDVDQSAWVNVGSLQGPKGDKGDKGEKGDTGATGAQGPKGETGATGPQGPQGEQGPKGDTGATGATGAIGTSAYDAARDGGYMGTETEFNTALADVGDKANKAYAENITLSASMWASDGTWEHGWPRSANDTIEHNHLIVSPDPEDFVAYSQSGIRCTNHFATNDTVYVYFACETIPTDDINVNLLFLE